MADSRTPRSIVFWLWIAEVKPTNRTAISQAMTSAVSVAVVRMDLFQFENVMADAAREPLQLPKSRFLSSTLKGLGTPNDAPDKRILPFQKVHGLREGGVGTV